MAFDSAAHFIRDIVHYREPLISLTSKEFRVRYKHAALGFLWSILNPLLLMLVLSIVMRLIARFPGIEHYPVFVLCGLIPWTFLAHTLSRSTGVLLENASLIQKVSFPREIITLSTVLSCFMNFLLSLLVLFFFVLAFGYMPSWWIVMVAVIVVAELLFVSGIALAVSCLNVFFRDVAYIVEALLLVWWWGTPIFYPEWLIEEKAPALFYRIYMMNPMAALVVSLRQVLLERRFPDINLLVTLCVVAVVTFVVGLLIFRRTQAAVVDYV